MDIERNDGARGRDQISAERGVTIDDEAAFRGVITLDRYTEERPGRALALLEMEGTARLGSGLYIGPKACYVNGDEENIAPEDLILLPSIRETLSHIPTLDEIEDELRSLLTDQVSYPNLITQSGDQYYGDRAAAIAGAPAQVAAFKLGTGSTAPSKTGAGAALVTYLSGSNKAIDATYPQSSLSGASRQEQWKVSWGAGVINGSALREVVMVNDNTNATSTEANTYSRALFGPNTLGILDTLALTWNQLLLGS